MVTIPSVIFLYLAGFGKSRQGWHFFLSYFELTLAAFSVEMSWFTEQLQRNVSNNLTANISLVAWGVYCLRCKTFFFLSFFFSVNLPGCAQMHVRMRKNLSISPQSFDQPNFSLAMLSWCINWQKPHRWHFQIADSNAFLSFLVVGRESKENAKQHHPFPKNVHANLTETKVLSK